MVIMSSSQVCISCRLLCIAFLVAMYQLLSGISSLTSSSIASKNLQDHGKTSATASLGMITLWDVEGGLPQIDKYLYSRDNHVVAGEPHKLSGTTVLRLGSSRP